MSAEKIIKVGFCVAYDWILLKKSVPRIYEYADTICLSIDRNRKSWAGQTYEFNEEAFRGWLDAIDTEKKIDLYEDDFALPNLSAMKNDNRQRNMMAARMGKGGWHIQIDSDEYFVDFKKFVDFLKSLHGNPTGTEKPVNICGCWIPLIKKLPHGFLYVDFKNSLPETAPVATNVPVYERARNNGHFNLITPHYVVHETWSRSENELWFKINNWGHSDEELDAQAKKISYYNLWKALDEYNYSYVINFHPAIPSTWPALNFIKASSTEEVVETLRNVRFPLNPWKLFLRNSRNVARVKHIWNKLFAR
jgi:hypothetical protein